MVRFLVNIFMLLLLVTLFTLWIASVKISDAYVIAKTRGTSYGKIAWNLELIRHQPLQIKGKNLFFGSSLVQSAVNDSLLAANGIPALNCATNGNGNELVYYFLQRMLPHQPARVFLQLYKTDKTGLHSLTPMMLTPKELIEAGQSINLHFVEYLFKRLHHVLDYLWWNLSDHPEEHWILENYGQVNADSSSYSASSYAAIDTVAMRDYFNFFRPELVNYQLSTDRNKSAVHAGALRLGRKIYYALRASNFLYNGTCQTNFVGSAFQLCQNYQIPVSRLYVPLVADVKIAKEFDESFYVPSRYLNVLSLKDFSCLDSAQFWSDRAHLSRKGSSVFTFQLMKQNAFR